MSKVRSSKARPSKIKLKACPFCAADNAELFEHNSRNSYWYVGCLNCDAEGPPSDVNTTAAEYWNFRPTAPK